MIESNSSDAETPNQWQLLPDKSQSLVPADLHQIIQKTAQPGLIVGPDLGPALIGLEPPEPFTLVRLQNSPPKHQESAPPRFQWLLANDTSQIIFGPAEHHGRWRIIPAHDQNPHPANYNGRYTLELQQIAPAFEVGLDAQTAQLYGTAAFLDTIEAKTLLSPNITDPITADHAILLIQAKLYFRTNDSDLSIARQISPTKLPSNHPIWSVLQLACDPNTCLSAELPTATLLNPNEALQQWRANQPATTTFSLERRGHTFPAPLGIAIILAETNHPHSRPTISAEQLELEDSQGVNGWTYAMLAGRLLEAIQTAPDKWQSVKNTPQFLSGEHYLALHRPTQLLQAFSHPEIATRPTVLHVLFQRRHPTAPSLVPQLSETLLTQDNSGEKTLIESILSNQLGQYLNPNQLSRTLLTTPFPTWKTQLGNTPLDILLSQSPTVTPLPIWIQWANEQTTPPWDHFIESRNPEALGNLTKNIPPNWMYNYSNAAQAIAFHHPEPSLAAIWLGHTIPPQTQQNSRTTK